MLLVLLSMPSLANATELWRGDFETGDLSQWSRSQQVSSDRLRVVSSPTRQGRHALRVEVRQGDDPINASGNRAELVQMTNEAEGDERYYG
ncbi:MAG: heparin lyase I family protein, partial [Deltaproteobacteria bacterium]|nr:heparin lyase I family protein [Deltaproteobacteria bacterium]